MSTWIGFSGEKGDGVHVQEDPDEVRAEMTKQSGAPFRLTSNHGSPVWVNPARIAFFRERVNVPMGASERA